MAFPRLIWKTEVIFQVAASPDECVQRVQQNADNSAVQFAVTDDGAAFYARARDGRWRCGFRGTIEPQHNDCTIRGYVGLELGALTWIAFILGTMMGVVALFGGIPSLSCLGMLLLMLAGFVIIIGRVWVHTAASDLSQQVYKVLNRK